MRRPQEDCERRSAGPEEPRICKSLILITIQMGYDDLIMAIPCISLLTDFGSREAYVGAMKGVLLSGCPEAAIVDVSHEVGSHDLLEAAFTLSCVYAYFPPRTIHLVVVDPGVGSERRGIVASSEKYFFVAPDNGVLSLVYEKAEINRVHAIDAEHYYLQPVSPTFHGRDIFAPVAAQIARGIEVSKFGPQIDDYVRLNLPPVKQTAEREAEGLVLHIDRFGNIVTSITPEDLTRIFGPGTSPRRFRLNGRDVGRHCRYYAEAADEEVVSLVGSAGYFEIAASKRPAARLLQAKRGMKVQVKVQSIVNSDQ